VYVGAPSSIKSAKRSSRIEKRGDRDQRVLSRQQEKVKVNFVENAPTVLGENIYLTGECCLDLLQNEKEISDELTDVGFRSQVIFQN
jgi:hypothetical protein